MTDTLPTTPETAVTGTAAALYTGAEGTLGVQRVTTGIRGLASAGIPATPQSTKSNATPCQHVIATTLIDIGRAPTRAEPSTAIALDPIAAWRSRLDWLGQL